MKQKSSLTTIKQSNYIILTELKNQSNGNKNPEAAHGLRKCEKKQANKQKRTDASERRDKYAND